MVNQFNINETIGKTPIVLSVLIKSKTKEFCNFLKKERDLFQVDKKYALRLFVESYIDI